MKRAKVSMIIGAVIGGIAGPIILFLTNSLLWVVVGAVIIGAIVGIIRGGRYYNTNG